MLKKEFEIKKYEKLKLPHTSAWDKKTYDPVLLLYRLREDWSETSDILFDIWFKPKRFLMDLWSFGKRLWVWIPVLWRDRDWDDFFIFEIVKKKLITQRKYLVDNYRHTNVPEINRDMTICLNLIERFQNSFYEIEYFDYIDYESDFVPAGKDEESGQEVYELNQKTKRDDLIQYLDKFSHERDRAIKRIKTKNSQKVEDYRENSESRQLIALYMSQQRHEKCKKLIFRILSDKIEYWWD